MIPQLRRQTKWPIHLITPTAHPLQALATSLTRDSESVTATATLIMICSKKPALCVCTTRCCRTTRRTTAAG